MPHRSSPLLGLVLAALASTALLVPAVPAALAADAVARQWTQAPGFHRFKLGTMEVTAIYDGNLRLSTSLLKNITADDLESLLAARFLSSAEGVQTAVNAYLVNTGDRLVLVDSGAAGLLGPDAGGLVANIRAAGYEPSRIDTVLLTHLHPDHAGGLLSRDGKAAFPNATVRASQADIDFWLSAEVAAKAPADAQPFFKMARDAVAPYQAAGRFKSFAADEELLAGIRAVEAGGHTPGHSGFLLTVGDESLLVWGDIIHSHAVQFARPEVAIEFDIDSNRAVATRKRLLEWTAGKRIWVAGAHLPFPGIGHVRAEGTGYGWVPLEYAPVAKPGP
ncbi:MBL fold metallo-hydrolase [Niveispirillum fermenti]|uniref:MBL fold metallo-hydrolase n=1 Tax=Niveispirillum fermenti TaxID=1233113 RepID=UPI003A8A87E4